MESYIFHKNGQVTVENYVSKVQYICKFVIGANEHSFLDIVFTVPIVIQFSYS